jgi:hypothetical protein
MRATTNQAIIDDLRDSRLMRTAVRHRRDMLGHFRTSLGEEALDAIRP